MQTQLRKAFLTTGRGSGGGVSESPLCHSDSGGSGPARAGCHSGTTGPRRAAGLVAGLLLALAVPGQAPQLELSLAQGRTVLASRLTGNPDRGYEATVSGGSRAIRAADLIAVHGVAVQRLDLAAAWLPDGEVVRGTLTGGDPAGDTLTVLSPVLREVELSVDRLAAFVPSGNPGLTPAELPLPDGVDEALFVRAKIGFDLLAGSLHRFTPRGLRFAADGDERAQLFRQADFVALRIGDPDRRARTAAATLVTRTGDRLGVEVVEFGGDGVTCELENGVRVEVRHGDLACLSFHGACTYLSDLAPSDVIESGYDGPVLHPYRRDAAALGGPLVAADRTHGKGLGVHSRSRLSFVVPAGAASFWSRVALDDSAAALPLRANVDVRVFRAGEVVFEHRGLETGEQPRDTGLVTVRPGETLILEVDFGKGRDLGDRVDWLTPVFLPAPSR